MPVLQRLSACCSSSAATSIPGFLLPAFAARTFATSPSHGSRIGAAPISIPPEVTLTLVEPPPSRATSMRRVQNLRTVQIHGPLGDLSLPIPAYMQFSHDPKARKATLTVQDRRERRQREMWGTTRALLNNHVLGVSEGHTAILGLNGVGFRASIEKTATTKAPAYEGQEFVNLKVGYSHPIELGLPMGVRASTPQPTRILLEGRDRETVTQFAAEIRAWRKPEPYKGKGIFVNGETIRLKAKKIK